MDASTIINCDNRGYNDRVNGIQTPPGMNNNQTTVLQTSVSCTSSAADAPKGPTMILTPPWTTTGGSCHTTPRPNPSNSADDPIHWSKQQREPPTVPAQITASSNIAERPSLKWGGSKRQHSPTSIDAPTPMNCDNQPTLLQTPACTNDTRIDKLRDVVDTYHVGPGTRPTTVPIHIANISAIKSRYKSKEGHLAGTRNCYRRHKWAHYSLKTTASGHSYIKKPHESNKLCPECGHDAHSYRYWPQDLDVFKSVRYSVCGQILTKELWLQGYHKDPCTYLRYLQSAKAEHEGDQFLFSDDSFSDTEWKATATAEPDTQNEDGSDSHNEQPANLQVYGPNPARASSSEQTHDDTFFEDHGASGKKIITGSPHPQRDWVKTFPQNVTAEITNSPEGYLVLKTSISVLANCNCQDAQEVHHPNLRPWWIHGDDGPCEIANVNDAPKCYGTHKGDILGFLRQPNMIDLLPKTQLPAMITDNKQFTLYLLRQQDLVTKKPKAGNQKHSCDDELQQTDQAANHIGEYGRSGIDMTREHHRINISHLLQCPTHGSNYRMVGLDWAKIRVQDTRMIHNRNLNCIYPRLTCPHCSTDGRFLTLFEDKYY